MFLSSLPSSFPNSLQFVVVQLLSPVSLHPHGLQHTRRPCSSLSSGVCSNPRPLSRWCHPTISSSVAPFSSCPQSFPASGSFPVCQLFASGDRSVGASASVLPMNIQGWFPLGLTGLISLQSKGLPSVFSSTTVRRHQMCAIAMGKERKNAELHSTAFSLPGLWFLCLLASSPDPSGYKGICFPAGSPG